MNHPSGETMKYRPLWHSYPVLCSVLAVTLPLTYLHADDWPEWRGKGRLGVWNESGILDEFPKDGLAIQWRTPINGGYAGPSVADGRVFVTDFTKTHNTKGTERILCLDEKTGRILWTQQWDADYIGLMDTYAGGPRATPTVDGDRVYVLGAKGALVCLKVKTGEVIWKHDYVKDYDTQVPTWGITGAPVIDGDRVIGLVGGAGNAKVMAFDKRTGKEVWRALSSEREEPGYAQPILFDIAGVRQLIMWHPLAVVSLDPATGKVNWQQPFKVHNNVNLATPVMHDSRLLVSSFYNGSMLLDLSHKQPVKLWQGKSDSEIDSDGLHSLISTPVFDGDYIYGVCGYGQFRCLRASTGERVWETMAVTGEKARWTTAFIVRQSNRFFINNDHGELIIAKLSPEGYQEISRTKLIKPTSNPGNRRQLAAVNWSQPAYANKHIIARNDEEIISASLAK
jgi:outer membrane protein assembly factor BamB